MYSIYCVENKLTNNKYIGITSLTPPDKCWEQHCEDYKIEENRKTGYFRKFYRSLYEDKPENFEFSVIDQSDDFSYIEEIQHSYIVTRKYCIL